VRRDSGNGERKRLREGANGLTKKRGGRLVEGKLLKRCRSRGREGKTSPRRMIDRDEGFRRIVKKLI